MRFGLTLLCLLRRRANTRRVGAGDADLRRSAPAHLADDAIRRFCVRFTRILAAPLAAGVVLALNVRAADADDVCDFFCYLGQANRASLVMLEETGLVAAPHVFDIARGIQQVIEEQEAEGSERSSNYLDFEARLLEISGPDASRLHLGRSRQDLHGTVRRMLLRDAVLESYGSLIGARRALVELAARHIDTVVPAYTHGVQAQPTSLAHFLLAFSSAFERDAQRLEQAYARINRSPLGAAALGTSGFPLDREHLAELLGFFGPVENSYDANLVSSVDSKVEFVNALAVSSLHVGQFVENLHTQYHTPLPWLMLGDTEQTDVSSIMPQKENPRALDRIRTHATAVLGEAHTVALNAHNTNTGMNDYRPVDPTLDVADHAVAMYGAYEAVVSRLRVDAQRALDEINSDYSTMTEVADVLLRHAGVPFREGHHYASELTRYGRANGKRPIELTEDELRRIYRESAGADLPIDVELLTNAMDPEAMVRNRRGLGGPQPDEAARMLDEHRRSLAGSEAWLDGARMQLSDADQSLELAFRALLSNGSISLNRPAPGN